MKPLKFAPKRPIVTAKTLALVSTTALAVLIIAAFVEVVAAQPTWAYLKNQMAFRGNLKVFVHLSDFSRDVKIEDLKVEVCKLIPPKPGGWLGECRVISSQQAKPDGNSFYIEPGTEYRAQISNLPSTGRVHTYYYAESSPDCYGTMKESGLLDIKQCHMTIKTYKLH